MSLHPPGFIEPCPPTVSRTVPTGREWAFEIKHDGFRFIRLRDGKRMRAFARGGHDWSGQLPAVTEALRALPARSVTLDGEVVICASDGRSDFDRMRALFGRHGSPAAFLYAFDLLELDGRDLRNDHGQAAARRWRSSYRTAHPASGCASTSRMQRPDADALVRSSAMMPNPATHMGRRHRSRQHAQAGRHQEF